MKDMESEQHLVHRENMNGAIIDDVDNVINSSNTTNNTCITDKLNESYNLTSDPTVTISIKNQEENGNDGDGSKNCSKSEKILPSKLSLLRQSICDLKKVVWIPRADDNEDLTTNNSIETKSSSPEISGTVTDTKSEIKVSTLSATNLNATDNEDNSDLTTSAGKSRKNELSRVPQKKSWISFNYAPEIVEPKKKKRKEAKTSSTGAATTQKNTKKKYEVRRIHMYDKGNSVLTYFSYDKQRCLGSFNTQDVANQALDMLRIQLKEQPFTDAGSIDKIVKDVRDQFKNKATKN